MILEFDPDCDGDAQAMMFGGLNGWVVDVYWTTPGLNNTMTAKIVDVSNTPAGGTISVHRYNLRHGRCVGPEHVIPIDDIDRIYVH